VSVTSDGVPENASEATITLTALPSAAVGATKITVRAESFDHAFFQTATLDLEVRGASGTLDTTFGTGGIAAIAIAIPDAHEVERAAPPPAASATATTSVVPHRYFASISLDATSDVTDRGERPRAGR